MNKVQRNIIAYSERVVMKWNGKGYTMTRIKE